MRKILVIIITFCSLCASAQIKINPVVDNIKGDTAELINWEIQHLSRDTMYQVQMYVYICDKHGKELDTRVIYIKPPDGKDFYNEVEAAVLEKLKRFKRRD